MTSTLSSKIELNVELDENRVPEKLFWTADDGGITDAEAKAMMLSVWDHKAKEMLRIDLWTKDMPVDEMKIFFPSNACGNGKYIQQSNSRRKNDGDNERFLRLFC